MECSKPGRVDTPSIICFKWGRWSAEYVYKLKNMLERNVTVPYTFSCFTDEYIPGLHNIEIPEHIVKWKGNFTKFFVYSEDNGLSGRVIMIDLDSVIQGNIDHLIQYDGPWCGIRPLNNKTKTHRGGGLVSFIKEEHTWIYDDVAVNLKQYSAELQGKERYLYQKWFGESDTWQDLYPGSIASYKYDILKNNGLDAPFIAFHGQPRPHEVNHPIVMDHWK